MNRKVWKTVNFNGRDITPENLTNWGDLVPYKIIKDLSKRIQLGLAFGYTKVFNSPFYSKEILSVDFTEFQSIQEFDTALWNDRFRTSVRLTYYL